MMKSSFLVLFLGILIASMVLPVATLAVTGPVNGCNLVEAITYNGNTYGPGPIDYTTSDWGVFCFLNMMNIVINFIFVALMILVIIMVLMGAFNLMTAAGDTVKVKKGRDQIMYAAIGLIVALVAKAVPSIVSAIFG